MRECHCDVDKFSSCVLSHGYRSIEITTLCNLLRDDSSGFFLRIGARVCAPTNVTPVHVVRCVCVCEREFRITDGVQTECFGNHFKNCESAIAIISPCTSLVAASVLSAVMRCIQ